MENLNSIPSWLLTVIIVIVIWDTLWKAIALWKSARSNQLAWYICITIFNTVGILPIIYLIINKKKKE